MEYVDIIFNIFISIKSYHLTNNIYHNSDIYKVKNKLQTNIYRVKNKLQTAYSELTFSISTPYVGLSKVELLLETANSQSGTYRPKSKPTYTEARMMTTILYKMDKN